jgi:hypothetical protein
VEVTKSTISAIQKRQRDDAKESSLTEKGPKVSAIETGVQDEWRFWKQESAEEDFKTSLAKPQLGLYIYL